MIGSYIFVHRHGNPIIFFEILRVLIIDDAQSINHDLNPGEFWPRYEKEGAKDWVFDAEVEGLGYAETDDWRKAGIDLINSWDSEKYGR